MDPVNASSEVLVRYATCELERVTKCAHLRVQGQMPERYRMLFTKLTAFSWTEYDRVLMLDAGI